MKYRKDIDGLRAYAVVAVIIYHLGFLPNGYLGVDVFFVISGYLITSIIYHELINGSFSIWKFYERRIRRIIPLLLFITTFSLGLGFFFMLPDDLENLAQSVFASNVSANNVLMLITSSDYWAIKNDYKLLMHTWSLGVEEQYYIIYPFLLLLVSKINSRNIFYFLVFSSIISISLFLFAGNPASRFYLLHFRYFELSMGGMFAVAFFGRKVKSDFTIRYSLLFATLGMLACLFTPIDSSNRILIISTTLFAVASITTGGLISEKHFFSRYFLENGVVVYIGKISFSLYLWHQVIFAFMRYTYLETISVSMSLVLITITFIFSVITYHFIENIFRNRKLLSTKSVLISIGVVFILSTSSALYIYLIGGVYKEFNSLDIGPEDIRENGYNLFSSAENIHISYNQQVRKLDMPFEHLEKNNVLILGDSFGRDVANILLESNISPDNELSYFDINRAKDDESFRDRWLEADLVIVAANGFLSKEWITEIGLNYGMDINLEKIYVFGTKDFGYSNGIHYNRLSSVDEFSMYYANMRKGTLRTEELLKIEWGSHYISLIEPISNRRGQIRIFDNNGKFLSQDTLHLTKAGARFYSELLEETIEALLKHNLKYD